MKGQSIFWFERSELRPILARLSSGLARPPHPRLADRDAPPSESARHPTHPLERQARVLVELLREKQIAQGDFTSLATAVATAAVEGLDVERASLWMFEAASGWLKGVASSQRLSSTHEIPEYLPTEQFPNFFAALAARLPLAAEDALEDPRTVELVVRSVVDPELCSFLAVPILQGDYLAGVLCIEHTRYPRRWSADDEAFAAALASYLGAALACSELRKLAAEHARIEGRLRLQGREEDTSSREKEPAPPQETLATETAGKEDMERQRRANPEEPSENGRGEADP
ncbi:MAG: GAF domain-containing protein [Myxococcales bacterium]|nr:GAF domain-containing protein [Polyangiaceae bacterium]MDW8251553.1 GAF domain-containing protein [Myxococcales bacterium]